MNNATLELMYIMKLRTLEYIEKRQWRHNSFNRHHVKKTGNSSICLLIEILMSTNEIYIKNNKEWQKVIVFYIL